jgi:4-hydroxy-tetrahydrodipicolinate reductase
MSLRAALVGPGRMGSAVAGVWRERGNAIAVEIGRGDDLAAGVRGAAVDVAFELSRPEAAAANVDRLLALGVPTVCGTTGWDPEPARRRAAEEGVPLLVAANFSLGVAVLRAAVAEAARRLAAFPELEPGIVERHHAEKADSPSGTAKMLAATIAEALGTEPPIVALRHGGQPGEHRVIFEGADEEVELLHRARSRRAFALGAALAGEWLATERPPGPQTFEDFLERSRR